MTGKYDALTLEQKELCDKLREVLAGSPPADWFDAIDALRDEAIVDALSRVPYEGPHPLWLSPR